MKNSIKIFEKNYKALIKEVENIILPLLEVIDIKEISRRNIIYERYEEDRFKYFVESERRRFSKALNIIISDRKGGKVCDLGCFIPYLPVALSILGYQVKIVDKYEFYGNSFKNSIYHLAEKKSIKIFDFDILNDSFDILGKNDVVINMAVVEHFNGTPRYFLQKIHSIIADGGFLIFDVPNIAEFIKRIRLLFGFSPLADYNQYFYSEYPFMGHNREMTVDEVIYMLEHSNFKVEHLECYDFCPNPVKTLTGKLALILKNILPIKYKKESIIAKARPITPIT